MKKYYELRTQDLMKKYKGIVEAWRDEEDDRRMAYNMYIQLLGAYRAMDEVDATNTFVKMAVDHEERSQRWLMDSIISRMTGMEYSEADEQWHSVKEVV